MSLGRTYVADVTASLGLLSVGWQCDAKVPAGNGDVLDAQDLAQLGSELPYSGSRTPRPSRLDPW